MMEKITQEVGVSAAAYVRLSPTSERDADKVMDNQRDAIRAYASRMGLKIERWFEDKLVSGAQTSREGLDALLESIDEYKDVIVYDLSRLTRDFEQSTSLMFFFQKHEVRVHIVHENRVLSYDDDVLMLVNMIQGWTAQYERKMIHKRQKLGIERYRATRGHWGPKKIEIPWKRYDTLRAAGVSKAAIARILGVSIETINRRLKERGGND